MPAATEPAGGAHRSDGDTRVDSARVRAFVLAATVLASAMAFIDGSVVTIALPVIQTEFAARFQALQWVVNAYTLMLGALILVGGALGDRVGRRRVFVVGIAIFAAASLTCALAASVKMLIAARAVQGLGAALLVPQSLAIIAASFPRAVRGRAIGVWAAASAITTSLGPPLGGFVIDTWSWRAAFLINLPLSAAALLLAFTHVPESRDRSATGRLDWPGSLLAVLSLGALTYGLTQLSGRTSGTGMAPAALIVAAVGFVAFWRVERRARNPILPAVLFRSRTFLAANVLTLFLYGALAGVLFLLPFDLIARRGMAASAVGLTLLPFSLIIGLLSRSAGGLADRFGARNLLVGGSLVAAAAILCVALDLSNYWLGVFVPITAMALGMAAVVTPLTTVGDERRVRRAVRRRLGREQRGKPHRRPRLRGDPRRARRDRSSRGVALRPMRASASSRRSAARCATRSSRPSSPPIQARWAWRPCLRRRPRATAFFGLRRKRAAVMRPSRHWPQRSAG